MSSDRKPVPGTLVPQQWLDGLQDESAAARLPTRLDAPPRENRATSCGKHGGGCAGRCRRRDWWKRLWVANRRSPNSLLKMCLPRLQVRSPRLVVPVRGQWLHCLHHCRGIAAAGTSGPGRNGLIDGCFLSSLWRVLACGLNNSDALRRRFLLELHGNGRGLSAWMSACSAVPSGLPAPFRPMLPPLTSHMRIIATTFSSPGNRNPRSRRMLRGSGCGSSTERFGMRWS